MLTLLSILAAAVFLILLWQLKAPLTRLRNAVDLLQRVEAVEGTALRLQFEWTDTLDKLLAREERWRKRYKAEVNGVLEIPTPPAVEHPASRGDAKGALRARLGAIRQAGG